MRFVLVMTCLLSLSFSCQKRKDDAPAPASTEPFLAQGDMAPGSKIGDLAAGTKINSLSSDDAKKEIEESSDFMDDTDDSSSLALSSDCVSEKLYQLPLKATGGRLETGGTLDLTSCAKDNFEAQSSRVQVTSLEMRLSMQLICNSDDLSKYNGKNFKDLSVENTENPCPNSTGMEQLTHSKTTMKSTVKYGGDEYKLEQVLINAIVADDGSPCKAQVSSGAKTYANCSNVKRYILNSDKINGKTGETVGTEDYTKLVYKNLVSAKGTNNKWYQSGSMDVTFNDWEGEVKYSDVATAPTYTIKNGSETISGTIVGSSSTTLNLQGSGKNKGRSLDVSSVIENSLPKNLKFLRP